MEQSHLPPKMPSSAPEIERVIHLLNLRAQDSLEKAERHELKELLGIYPTPAQAVVWRQGLKRILDSTDGTAKKLISELEQADDQEESSAEE